MGRWETVAFENVRAVGGGLTLIFCEVAGLRVGVPHFLIAPESEVRKKGDQGRLVIPRTLAIDLDLL